MRYKIARRILLFWCLFIGIGAVAGGIGMLTDISGGVLGFDEMLPYFQTLPFAEVLFQDFLFPGISLLVVNGLTNLTAAVFLIKRKRAGYILGGIFGVTLMLWICIQFIILPANFMSTIYFLFGFLQAAAGYACHVFYKQENYEFDKSSYRNVGKALKKSVGERELVIYFSRLGRTAKAAYEYADKHGADIYEIKTTEKIDGTLGFWWCGRFGMHGWPMPAEPVNIKLEDYDRICICMPVWVFRCAGPIRDFAQKAAGRIRKVNYIAVHFNPWLPKGVFAELDKILGIKAEECISISSALGHLKQRSIGGAR